MNMIERYKSRVEKLRKDLDKIGRDAVMKNEYAIVELFQDNQLRMGLKKGTNKDLVFIRRKGSNSSTYAPATQEYWIEYNHPKPVPFDKTTADVITLEWSGDFYSAMRVAYQKGGSYFIISTDKKTAMLLADYGDLFTLGDKVRAYIESKVIAPDANAVITQRLNALI